MNASVKAPAQNADAMLDGGPRRLVEMRNLSKVFVTEEVETHALAGVDLVVRDGEFVAIAGPSGCGKTTLLSILGLLDTPTAATTSWPVDRWRTCPRAQRAHIRNREIGFIFQAFNLIGDLTVHENVELPLTYRAMPSNERKRRVQDALERVGMSHRVRSTIPPALGRSAAARRRCACDRRDPAAPARRRAHRQPRLARTARR